MMYVSVGLRSHKCKWCEKKFESRPEYAYKLPKYKTQKSFYTTGNERYFYFCSYGHLREYERKYRTEQTKPDEFQQKVIDLMDDGYSMNRIAKMFGVSDKKIRRIRDIWRLGMNERNKI